MTTPEEKRTTPEEVRAFMLNELEDETIKARIIEEMRIPGSLIYEELKEDHAIMKLISTCDVDEVLQYDPSGEGLLGPSDDLKEDPCE